MTANALSLIATFVEFIYLRNIFELLLQAMALVTLVYVLLLIFKGGVWRKGHQQVIVCGVALILVTFFVGYVISAHVADVRWYTLDAKRGDKLVTSKTLRVKDEWVSERRASVPIRLAFTNKSDDPLTGVTVQIGYPHGYRVLPQGEQRLDEDSDLLIYEHPLDDLKVDGNYVMIKKPDILVLPVLTDWFRLVVPGDGGIPQDLRAVAVFVGGRESEVRKMPLHK